MEDEELDKLLTPEHVESRLQEVLRRHRESQEGRPNMDEDLGKLFEGIKPMKGPDENWEDEDPEPVHRFFGLSYDKYDVLPRVVLQSMPLPWQREYVKFRKKLEEAMSELPEQEYRVTPGKWVLPEETDVQTLRAAGIGFTGDEYYYQRTGRDIEPGERIFIEHSNKLPGYRHGRVNLKLGGLVSDDDYQEEAESPYPPLEEIPGLLPSIARGFSPVAAKLFRAMKGDPRPDVWRSKGWVVGAAGVAAVAWSFTEEAFREIERAGFLEVSRVANPEGDVEIVRLTAHGRNVQLPE